MTIPLLTLTGIDECDRLALPIGDPQAIQVRWDGFSAADLRNLFGVLNFIEREEIEAAFGAVISDDAWRHFPRDFSAMFSQSNDAQQAAMVDLINSKLSRGLTK